MNENTGQYNIYNTRFEMIRSLVPAGSKICEVGVFKGDMAKRLYNELQTSELILIDLFEGIVGSGDQDGNNFEFANLTDCYNHLNEYFKGKNVKIVKGFSYETLQSFPDNYFDMIYIDGDHSYQGCKDDLNISYKKVKSGGYIMGHDYEMNMNKANQIYNFGVKQAVDEFCMVYNQHICTKALDGCVSYAIKLKK